MTPTAISAFARMTALSDAQRRPRARVAPVRRRPRRLRHGRRRGRARARTLGPRGRTRRAIYGEVVGYGRNADAYHITAPSPGGEGAAACMQLALEDAGLAAGDDRSRQRARHVHAAERRGRGRGDPQGLRRHAAPPVTSTKGVTGHLVGAAGATEAVACLLAMRNRRGAADREPRAARRRHRARRRRGRARDPRARAGAVELVRVRRPQRHADPRARFVTLRRRPRSAASTPIQPGADVAAPAELREIDGRQVVWFRIAGGKHHGAIGVAGGATVERAVRLAGELRDPARRRARHVGCRAPRGRRRAPRMGPARARARRASRAWSRRCSP